MWGLDVDVMRAGAAWLVGEHDFRNLCKMGPAKQLTSFRRRVVRTDISHIIGGSMHVHILGLVDNPSLYNQVRHTVAVLLLISVRLEVPSVMLNTDLDDKRVAVLPKGKELPQRTQTGLHRAVLAVGGACEAQARRGDHGRTLPCRGGAVAWTCYTGGMVGVNAGG
ncbi:hypothetical protein EDB92DRAFT_1578524 [Lactarius akahatsu]|uniref:Pseudouridine synthase I TruA alpha/beta domain-containing protein n=1 Tax=Lactarius akahatsu TaxID=416441 RepID=A0AAD4L992_9AGAM|nr:hypothetical protein EDB92DRAFT_1578524 [Lactarius akahatsu]